MSLGQFRVPQPYNEAVKTYAPGSPEKVEVKSALADLHSGGQDVPLVIGGKHVHSQEKGSIHPPHRHKDTLAIYNKASDEHVKQAIDAALAARPAWAALPWSDRAAVFLRAADLLATKYRARMNALTMLGQSKTIFQAEIDAVCELVDFYRFNAFYLQKIQEDQPLISPAGQWNRLEVRGLEGFVYAVAPFNFTSISINLAAAPALMGCTVVWKPAPTALAASFLGLQILEEAGLPPGVINMVAGDPARISNQVLAHPELAGIHFTGSTGVFNHLWSAVGNRIGNYRHYPRLVGETGGKDFVFAHPHCDEVSLMHSLIRGAFEYQGQKCSAASRAYIPRSVWNKIRAPLIAAVQDIKIGDPEDFTNFMSAVIDARAYAKIKSYIVAARESNDAQIIAGGECDDRVGYFIRPTLIETANPHHKCMVEEIFGPVLTVYPYDDARIEETLELVGTSTPYALTGAIFATDRRDITHLSERLRYAAGNFYINDKPTGAVVGQQPFGGSRASGTNDKAGSPLNLQRWVSPRAIKENFLPLTSYRYPFLDAT
jgi:1-pyrroline-5-carboxylate dehydrogenase